MIDTLVYDSIDVGARRRRSGQRWKTYRVVGIHQPKHHLPHVQLLAETREGEMITISLKTIRDGRYWRPA